MKVILKPNTNNKTKWYYKPKHANLLTKPFTVTELPDEPVFTNCYSYDNGTYFISKEDCKVLS